MSQRLEKCDFCLFATLCAFRKQNFMNKVKKKCLSTLFTVRVLLTLRKKNKSKDDGVQTLLDFICFTLYKTRTTQMSQLVHSLSNFVTDFDLKVVADKYRSHIHISQIIPTV